MKEEYWNNLLGESFYQGTRLRIEDVIRRGLLVPNWNWAAFFFGIFWLIYRRLDGVALAYWFFLALLAVAVQTIATAIWFLPNYIIVGKILLPMYADSIVVTIVNRRINIIRDSGGDPASPVYAGTFAPLAFTRRPA